MAAPKASRARVSSVLGWVAALLAAYCGPVQLGSGESHTGNALSGCFAQDEDASVCADRGKLSSDLTCACAVCTYTCQDDDDCREQFGVEGATNTAFLENVRCRDALPICSSASVVGVCEVSCEEDTDCEEALGAGRCLNGFCRKSEPKGRCDGGRVFVPGDGEHPDLCFDATEVTVVAYRACASGEGCIPTTEGNAYEAASEQLPIDFVTVDQARIYCDLHDGRLPTRAEWQWAASNGTLGSEYPWGGWTDDNNDVSRVCSDAEEVACAVATHPAGNTLTGLADLAGNLAEFVTDGDDVYCAAGGSFSDARGGSVTPEAFAASSCVAVDSEQATETVGFRCVGESD